MIDQLGGRKFILTVIGLVAMGGLPLLYHWAGISETITQIVLGAMAAGIGSFSVTNALATKWAPDASLGAPSAFQAPSEDPAKTEAK